MLVPRRASAGNPVAAADSLDQIGFISNRPGERSDVPAYPAHGVRIAAAHGRDAPFPREVRRSTVLFGRAVHVEHLDGIQPEADRSCRRQTADRLRPGAEGVGQDDDSSGAVDAIGKVEEVGSITQVVRKAEDQHIADAAVNLLSSQDEQSVPLSQLVGNLRTVKRPVIGHGDGVKSQGFGSLEQLHRSQDTAQRRGSGVGVEVDDHAAGRIHDFARFVKAA